MKYVILVADGVADRPLPELGGRTPLQAAETPNLDYLAARGAMGQAITIPEKAPEAGSDVGNLSILGYDPLSHACGRGPLEAANIGVDLGPGDVAFRCNLITRDGDKLIDYSAGHIGTEDAGIIMGSVQAALGLPNIRFYPGVSYRHLMVWRDGPARTVCHPPHDFTGGSLMEHWPQGPGADTLGRLIRDSWDLLDGHPVNTKRKAESMPPANSLWFWGQGLRPELRSIPERFNLTGIVISAVDLINGLGRLAGLRVVRVPGATGYLDSNLAGKAQAALEALQKCDLAYVHVEAPDEASHEGSLPKKIGAIELFDAQVVGPIMEGLKGLGPHRILVMPDHATPLSVKTHTREPVPFVIYESLSPSGSDHRFSEADSASGVYGVIPGHHVIELFLK